MNADDEGVVITGFGVFSAAGYGPAALRDSVFRGRPGFREVSRFDTAVRRAHRAAQAPGSPSLGTVLERVARSAIEMSGLGVSSGAAVLLGTQGDWRGLTSFWRGESPAASAGAIAGTHADALAARLGIPARRCRVFNNGCIASATAIAQGAAVVAAGRETAVLAGGGYLVDEEFFAKFDSGRALTTDEVMRPFSLDRSGLLLGDGVAVLVLESLRSARRRGASPLARVAGASLSADSHHVCRPHPDGDGLARAMSQAIRRAGLRPGDVGYVNAHGTATIANDAAETRALKAVFGSDVPPVSSTKSCTGHALEGTGALEAVISLLGLTDGMLPPTAGFVQEDPACDIDCVPNTARKARARAVLSSSSAFGGANAALVLTEPP